MKKPFLMVGLALSMAACSQVGSVGTGPDIQSPQPQYQVLGTLELSVVANQDQPTAQARFTPNQTTFSGQALPDLQNADRFPIVRKFTTVLEDFSNTRRYLTTVFELTNNFPGGQFDQVQFVTYTDPEATPPSVEGTPYHNIVAADGSSLDIPAMAQAIVPTNKKRLSRAGTLEDDPAFLPVNNSLTYDDRNDIQTVANLAEGGAKFPLPVTTNPFPATAERQQVLYSAFTAQNYNTVKATRFDAGDKGFVGFSLSFPRIAPSSSKTPYAFVVRYLVVTKSQPSTP